MERICYFFLSIVLVNLFKEDSDYVACVPTMIQQKKNNNVQFWGQENQPKPALFSSIGRDTSSAKRYMLSLYKYTTEKQMNSDEFVNETVVEKADTVVSFVNHAYLPRPNASDEEGAMFFDVQTLLNFVIESTLKSDLRIYLNTTTKTLRDTALRVTIHQIVIPKVRYTFITSRVINASTSRWHDFDILKASQSWKEDQASNNGIVIVCRSLDDKIRTFRECGLVDFKGESETRPFLVSFYQSGDEEEILADQLPQTDQNSEIYTHQRNLKKARMKRSLREERVRRNLASLFPRASDSLPSYTMTRKQHPPNTTCGRHALTISFEDLGWSDWIIAPEGYEAAYCGGDCPFPLNDNMNASNHAIIQTLVHMILPSDMPQPCCAPIRLEPLRVLFLDEINNIVMKEYGNMVVNDCGCQ